MLESRARLYISLGCLAVIGLILATPAFSVTPTTGQQLVTYLGHGLVLSNIILFVSIATLVLMILPSLPVSELTKGAIFTIAVGLAAYIIFRVI